MKIKNFIFLLICFLWLANNNILKAQSITADTLFMAGLKAKNEGDFQQAKIKFIAYLKYKPEEPTANYQLAKLYLSNNNLEEAEECIKMSLKTEPNNKWYKETEAEIYTLEGKLKKAIDVYTALANSEKINENYLLKAIYLLEKTKKYQEAFDLLEVLEKKQGSTEEIIAEKQNLYLHLNDVENAQKLAISTFEKDPYNIKSIINIINLYNNNNEAEKTEKYYQLLINKFSTDATAQMLLAQHFYIKKDTQNYEYYFKKAILNKAINSEKQLALLQTYIFKLENDSLQKKELLNLLPSLIEQHPEEPNLYQLFGAYLADSNQPQLAKKQFKKTVTLQPQNEKNWVGLLTLYSNTEDADSLLQWADSALQYFPKSARIWYFKGLGNSFKSNFTASVFAFKQAILNAINNTEISDYYVAMGDAFKSAKNDIQSDSSFEKAIVYNPENSVALNNYAYFLSLRKEHLDKAQTLSEASLKIQPDLPTFLDTYAWILFQKGSYELAHKILAKIVNENSDATLLEHFGDAKFQIGLKEDAIFYWNKALLKDLKNEKLIKKIKEKKWYE